MLAHEVKIKVFESKVLLGPAQVFYGLIVFLFKSLARFLYIPSLSFCRPPSKALRGVYLY